MLKKTVTRNVVNFYTLFGIQWKQIMYCVLMLVYLNTPNRQTPSSAVPLKNIRTSSNHIHTHTAHTCSPATKLIQRAPRVPRPNIVMYTSYIYTRKYLLSTAHPKLNVDIDPAFRFIPRSRVVTAIPQKLCAPKYNRALRIAYGFPIALRGGCLHQKSNVALPSSA